MDIKTQITKRFKKSKFELLDCSTDRNGSWDCIDEYIRSFLKTLNENKHISTLFSCEGHNTGDSAYLFFHVSKTGWNIFWQKVLPELSYKLCEPVHIPGFPETPNVLPYYQMGWTLSVTDNEHNSGINIHAELNDFLVGDTILLVSWEEKKKRFWQIMTEVFLKNFPNLDLLK